jgi:hypothetical protein
MIAADLVFGALRNPARLPELAPADWNALIRVARAERLLGSVAALAEAANVWDALPVAARGVLTDELAHVAWDQLRARWEIDRARHALAGLGAPVLLLKGSAYLHAGLPPARGRRIGDLDILVPRAALGDAEALLKKAGWQGVKDDPYDDRYYREWMHEIPPLVHKERGGVIDVHHTILPLTARLRPDAAALIKSATVLPDGLRVLGPAEMVLHAAAHLAYDGEFDGGARNLWDIVQLIEHFADDDFWRSIESAAHRHQLTGPLARSLRLARELYGLDSHASLRGRADLVDWLALRKIRSRDAFGIEQARGSRRLLYMRGHWLRMPPFMLARHLVRKWWVRRGKAHP